MKIYNTLTKRKEEFVPMDKNEVKIYVCGPTVYDFIHIGNARPYVIFDTLRRYLEYKGYNVIYVQNFTDVDDKIIKKANSESVAMDTISNRYIKEALKDADALNVKRPTFSPRVTEEIEEIKNMIQHLIDKKNAYEINGTVFFDTSSFKEYGKLSGKNLDELEIGSRISLDDAKRTDTDFVLWKPKKENEPFWSSPWGDGRPGWHIECSVMAKKYLGETIDIHAGGEDLMFPHHENEIAQSECANCKPFAKYWIHNGFINVDNEKMSKSKGNFFTIRDIAKKIPYDVIRFFILSGHYKAPMNFTEQALQSSSKGLLRIKNCVENIKYFIKNATNNDEEINIDLLNEVQNYKQKFMEEMDNDFNTSNAITCIFECVRLINSEINEETNAKFLQILLDNIMEMCDILAILYDKQTSNTKISDNEVEELILARQNAKKNKDYKIADEIRNTLDKFGIVLQDTSTGAKWSRR